MNNGTTVSLDLPPGTENATARTPIERFEILDSASGNGFAGTISWNGTNFVVDNLAFDGDNSYARDDVVATIGVAEVYEGDVFYYDDVTGAAIWQFEHKAVAATSTTGRTKFGIVRTGSYVDYGFGGYVYARTDGVDIPDSGQAIFSGDYAGVRDFSGRSGLEYVTGDATAAVDFNDFNDGNAVRISVTNRRYFDVAGTELTADINDALDITDSGGAVLVDRSIPVLTTVIGTSMMDSAGELVVPMTSTIPDAFGAAETLESGTFYGVISGAGANMELVGVLVVTSEDPRIDGVTARETGGIIAYR